MANFDLAVNYILANEGGIVNRPADKGGWTCQGITLKTLAEYEGHEISYYGEPPVGFAFDVDYAKKIYKKLYWDKNRLASISQQGMATAILDQVVNSGHNGILMAQQVCRDSLAPAIICDGIMGIQTLAELNGLDNGFFIEKYSERVVEHYKRICAKDVTQIEFLTGWMRRADRLLTLKDVI